MEWGQVLTLSASLDPSEASFMHFWGRIKATGWMLIAVSFSTVGEKLMLYEGLGGKAGSPRKAFLLNRGFLHTNRHKLACCLNRILAIIIYPARVSRVWCCLRLAVTCTLALLSIALCRKRSLEGHRSKNHSVQYWLVVAPCARLRTSADLADFSHFTEGWGREKRNNIRLYQGYSSVPKPASPPSTSWSHAFHASCLNSEWLYLQLPKDLIWPLTYSVPLHTGVWKWKGGSLTFP